MLSVEVARPVGVSAKSVLTTNALQIRINYCYIRQALCFAITASQSILYRVNNLNDIWLQKILQICKKKKPYGGEKI